MKIPLGLTVSPSSSDLPLVYKLKKSLYGLKHTSRQWFAKLSHALISRVYSLSLNNYSLLTKSSATSTVLIAVYVDDIRGNDTSEMLSLKAFLDKQFKIKDLEIVHYFLGFEVSWYSCQPTQIPEGAAFRISLFFCLICGDTFGHVYQDYLHFL